MVGPSDCILGDVVGCVDYIVNGGCTLMFESVVCVKLRSPSIVESCFD